MRAQLVANSMTATLSGLVEQSDQRALREYLNTITADERLLAVVVCRADGTLIYETERTPDAMTCALTLGVGERGGRYMQLKSGSVEVSAFSLETANREPIRLLIVHDLSFIDRRQSSARNYVLALAGVAASVLALFLGFVFWLLIRRWVNELVGDIRGRRFLDDARSEPGSRPLLTQIRRVLREVETTQRLEIDFHENWTPQALQQVVRDHLRCAGGVHRLEPRALHPQRESVGPGGTGAGERHGHGARAHHARLLGHVDRARQRHGGPARSSTLTTASASRPKIRATRCAACGSAQKRSKASTTASRTKASGRCATWRTCARPFAKPTGSSIRRSIESSPTSWRTSPQSKDPLILVQDYHFALLPRLLRERKPAATIALFWHIPWPNAETFGVCPWKQRDAHAHAGRRHPGLPHALSLPEFPRDGRSLHRVPDRSRAHDRDAAAATFATWRPIRSPSNGRRAGSRRCPTSRPRARRCARGTASAATCALVSASSAGISPRASSSAFSRSKRCSTRTAALREQNHAAAGGRAVPQQTARLPGAAGTDTEPKSSASTRSSARTTWKPIVLIDHHQEPREVFELFRAADFCIVNSLHDGMNLVAKEFVAARDDEDGVLILSTFAGASRELPEALLVNPFDVAETAAAIGPRCRCRATSGGSA